jgi:glycosyltransferase involved in cell wall biosynthesis
MKICFASPSVGSTPGGSETIIRQFAEHLSEKHKVTILTGKSQSTPSQENIKDAPYEVLTVPFWPRFSLKNNLASKIIPRLDPYKTESLSFYYNIKLRPKIKERIKKMDVLSTHYRLDSRLFSNLAFKYGVPSVFHILGSAYSNEFFNKDKSTLYVATDILTKNNLNSKHDINIENVVTPGIPSDVLLKNRENMDPNKKNLLFVGRLQPSKGLFELIEIFKRLSESMDDVNLTIIGDGDIKHDLMETVKKYGLDKKTIFKGAVAYENLFDYYFNSDLFVFPSKKETFGMVALEAMACGMPVIASDIPSLKEATGGRAIFVSSDDIDGWVNNIKKLLSDTNSMKKLSEKGREWAGNFTWEKKAEEYEKCLLKAVEKF